MAVVSSGFKRKLETVTRKMGQPSSEHELPLIGPNLVGIGTPYHDFNCGFYTISANKGPIALISQSGSSTSCARLISD